MHSLGSTASHTRAIQFIAQATSTTDTTTLPSGLEVGDLLIGMAINQEADTVTGWTVGGSGTSGALKYVWHWKYYEATDTQYNSNGGDISSVFVFRNVDPIYPFDTAATVATGATGLPNAPSITTVNHSSIVVALGFLDDDNATLVAPTNYRLINAVGETSSGSMAAAYREIVSAGAEDPDAFTHGSATDEWAAVSVALRSSAYSAPMVAYHSIADTTYTSGGYKYHKFTGNGTFYVVSTGSVNQIEVLCIAGGGGGGEGSSGGGGGGGGAGGVEYLAVTPTATNYAVVVGGGGAGATANTAKGVNGNASSFASTVVATDGGGGGGSSSSTTASIRDGADGGSGGGGAATSSAAGVNGVRTVSGEGSGGGDGGIGNGGGGGGGAGGNGGNATTTDTGGTGGEGINDYSVWATATSSGENGFFASGGGGGGDTTAGTASDGGGANGTTGATNATAATANTGGGGGGSETGNGSSGGSGIVIVRYRVA